MYIQLKYALVVIWHPFENSLSCFRYSSIFFLSFFSSTTTDETVTSSSTNNGSDATTLVPSGESRTQRQWGQHIYKGINNKYHRIYEDKVKDVKIIKF